MAAGLTASAAGRFSVASPAGDFQVVEDGLEGKCPSWSQAFYQYSEPMANFTLEADVTPLTANPGEPGTRSGFIIGSDKAANKYIFIAIDSWNENTDKGLAANCLEYGVEKGFDGGMGIEVPFISAMNTTYEMKVQMQDYHCTVSVDGTQLIEFDVAETNRYGEYFGLMACIGSTLFDNVKVNGEVVYSSSGETTTPDTSSTEEPDDSSAPAGNTSSTEEPDESQDATKVPGASATEADGTKADASGNATDASDADEGGSNTGLIIGVIVVIVVVAAGVVVAGLLIAKNKKKEN